MKAWCAMLCTPWHQPANSLQAVANITIGFPPAEHNWVLVRCPASAGVRMMRRLASGQLPAVHKFSSTMHVSVAQRHYNPQRQDG